MLAIVLSLSLSRVRPTMPRSRLAPVTTRSPVPVASEGAAASCAASITRPPCHWSLSASRCMPDHACRPLRCGLITCNCISTPSRAMYMRRRIRTMIAWSPICSLLVPSCPLSSFTPLFLRLAPGCAIATRPPWDILNLDYSTALNASAVREAFSLQAEVYHPDRNIGCPGQARSEFIAARRARDTLLALSVLNAGSSDPSRPRFAKLKKPHVAIPSTRRPPSSVADSRRGVHEEHEARTPQHVPRVPGAKRPTGRSHATTTWRSIMSNRKHAALRRVSLVGASIPLLVALQRWLKKRSREGLATAKRALRHTVSSWWRQARRALDFAAHAPLKITDAVLGFCRRHQAVMAPVLMSAIAVQIALA